MPVTLESEERDALFFQLSVELDLLGDLQMAISKGNEEECYKLGPFSDALRLVIEGGLGEGEDPGINCPYPPITRIVERIQQGAMVAIEHSWPGHEESCSEWEAMAAFKDACQSVLNQSRS